MWCQRCLGGNYLKQWDEYDGEILKCLQCGHRIKLNGSPLVNISGKRARTPVYKKRRITIKV